MSWDAMKYELRIRLVPKGWMGVLAQVSKTPDVVAAAPFVLIKALVGAMRVD
jgi:hypothetical protein